MAPAVCPSSPVCPQGAGGGRQHSPLVQSERPQQVALQPPAAPTAVGVLG